MKAFKEQLETRFTELESRITLLFQLMKEKNEKKTSLESILKENSVSLRTKTSKSNVKNDVLEKQTQVQVIFSLALMVD